ncbi:MAG: hypothetical protein IKH86_00840 [Prevotella sp.]|nr:hypothetical protein [Prevotella sp.]
MKKLLFTIIIIGMAILMTQTLPDKKEHKRAMMDAVKELVEERANEKGIADNAITRIGKNLVSKSIEAGLGAKLRMNNYFLFNTTHIKTGGEDKLLSVGVLGQVITFNKDMLRDALEESKQIRKEAKEEKKMLKAEQKRLKKQLKEQRKLEKKREKEARKREKEARKAQEKAEKERLKAEKERLKAEKRAMKD